ncbi:MAG: hypothetical protein Q8O75_01750 [bacterium]|nr:hypothetical protein [bacterium]
MPKEIVLDLKPKENKFKTYFPFVAAIIFLALVFFASGFAIGKYTEFEVPLFGAKEEATKSTTRKGWFVSETASYLFEYPKNWEVRKNKKDGPTGAKIEGAGGHVQFWITNVREYKFSKEQSDKQKRVTESKLAIDGRQAQVTQYLYKNGDFFIVVRLPAAIGKPKVIFWAIAANAEFKKTVMEIVTTFKGKKAVEKITYETNEQSN